MAVTSWLLFGVYQIGASIEDPFQGSLRLKILCHAIYRDVMFFEEDEAQQHDAGRVGFLRRTNHRDTAYELDEEVGEDLAAVTVVEALAADERKKEETQEKDEEQEGERDIDVGNNSNNDNNNNTPPSPKRP